MRELRDLAAKLLASGEVEVVIGWEEARTGVRPAFIRTAEDAGRLVFDSRCVHNLAAYLHPWRSHVAHLGRPAVVVKSCDARAVAGLIRENQVRRENVVLIGVRCAGVVDSPSANDARTAVLARRCRDCERQEPSLCDHLVGDESQRIPPGDGVQARVLELEGLPPEERWSFWTDAFDRCVRCYACREVCPLCFCERCVVEKATPQWIETSPHGRANMAWHLVRALHQAGRCVGCGECERACPANIPLTLLNARLQRAVHERFGFRVSDDPAIESPIGAFKRDDAQEFIR